MPLLLLVVDLPASHRELLAQTYEVVTLDFASIDADNQACQRAQIVWTHGMKGLSDQTMAALPKLEIVICQGVGYENIDLAAAARRGIAVANGSGTNSSTVADHAMALLLSLLRRTPFYDRAVRSGQWQTARRRDPILTGKRIGILGLGHIGRAIAQRARGFDCEIVYHTRRERTDCDYIYAPTPAALAEQSDVVIICCPGGAATHRMVDANVLRTLGPEGLLVNIARGTIIDTDALITALSQRQIAGAALDVIDGEPEVPAALLELDNLVLSPHVGGLSQSAFDGMVQQGLANLDAHFSGKPLLTPLAADS